MFYPLKIKSPKVFFFSDLHIRHETDFILTPRGFNDAFEAKEQLIRRKGAKHKSPWE